MEARRQRSLWKRWLVEPVNARRAALQLQGTAASFMRRLRSSNRIERSKLRASEGLNALEQRQLAADINELLAAGFIVKSRSEWAAPVFYVSKDGGKDRCFVCDYRALNRLIKRNNASLQHIRRGKRAIHICATDEATRVAGHERARCDRLR